MTVIPGLLQREMQREIDRAVATLVADVTAAVEPALEKFRAQAGGAAERAVLAAIEDVFARVAGDVPRMGRTRPQAAEPGMRAVEFLRTHPGATTREVARSLGMHTSTLRPHLRKLEDEGTIQSRGDGARGRPRRRTFFVVETPHVNVEHVELERVEVPMERMTPVVMA